MSVRNSLGQEIKVGSPVLLVTQGQGWVGISFGRVEKFSKNNVPQVRYVWNDGHYVSSTSRADGKLSPPITRYERLFVMDEPQFSDLEAKFALFSKLEENAKTGFPSPIYPAPGSGVSHQDYRNEADKVFKARRDYVDSGLQAAGFEPFYN